jgi:hypothetical protein
MKVSGLLPGNNEIPHVVNLTAKTMIAQTIVIASVPLVACNISNLLNNRNITILGKTHRVIEWVIIFVSFNLARYEPSDISPEENRKITIPIIKGKRSPLTRPVINLSYFSGSVIF